MITSADGPLLSVFAAVVRCGSFSAAAAALKLSKSVVSERVKALEARCGAPLLERTTRRIRLTEVGAEVLEVAVQLDDAFGQLSRRLDARRSEPTGVLRVASTADLGPLLVAPVAAHFARAHPKVRVELLCDDAPHDPLAAGVDLAVRLGAPKDSSFTVRRLAAMREPIVASPRVAEALGAAARPRDLASAPWVRHSLLAKSTLRFEGPRGAVEEVTPEVRVEANTGAAVLSLLVHGAGVGVLPEYVTRDAVAEGRLAVLCPGWIWRRVTLYALTPSRPSQRPALSAFLAMLREHMARDAARWAEAPLG